MKKIFTLILLAVAFVGTAKADMYLRGNETFGNWATDYKMTQATDGTYYYVFESLGTHSFSIKYQIYSSSAYAKSLKPGKSKYTVEAGKEKIIKYSTVPSKGLVLYEDITVDNPDVAEAYWYGLSSQELAVFGLKPGTAKITVKLDKGKKVTFTVKVTEAKKPYFDYKNYYLYTGEKINNWFYGGKTVTWSSGNKKIATVDKSGNVTEKTVGKTKITAKTNGKSYSYNLIVQRREPNFAAKVTAYYTRDNYFTVKIRNLGARPLTIKSGIKVENVDYKSFDRNVRLKKAVTIPKGKTKTVRFYVKGTNTWYDYADYTLFYKFVYDGKEYEGHVWYDDSVFKKPDKKWYTTYWEKDDELEIY